VELGFNLYSTILLLGAAQGLFLALALLSARGGNLVAHRLLAVLTGVFATDLVREVLYLVHAYAHATYLVAITDQFNFLYGPLIYFYVDAMTAPTKFRMTGKGWLHFLPCLAGYLLVIPFFTLDGDLKLKFLYEDVAPYSVHLALAMAGEAIIDLVSIIQIGIYLGLSIRQLFRHARSIRDQFSYTERINLTWTRNLLFAMVFLYLLYFADTFLPGTLGSEKIIDHLLMVMIVIVIYTMGYLGLRQPAIFARIEGRSTEDAQQEGSAAPQVEPRAVDQTRKKYQKSALDIVASEVLLADLQTYMAKQKPYLDGDLTLPDLARRLDISPNYLSQIINEQLDQNFFDFINRYRIEEVKRRLSDASENRDNFLTLALDAGFNSKSAFYTAFKKYTHMTPGEFKKTLTIS
jgi:AraC-like DNA-binding protein